MLSVRFFLISFLLYFAGAVGLQVRSGAYRAELCGYPDEPSHAVSSLMVHDYLRHPTASPLAFSKSYYLHYPKIAIGHWPPGFYVVNAVWIFLAGRSVAALLILQAVLAALAAATLAGFCCAEASRFMRLLAGAVFLLLAITRINVSLVMMENLVCVFGLGASIFLARFLDAGRTRDLALSAGAAVGAIMTHPSGWSLVPVYAGTVVVLGRFDILRRGRVWLIAAGAAAVVVPWYALTLRMTRNGIRSWSPSVAAEEFFHVLRLYPVVAGSVVLALAMAGALWTAYAILNRSPELKTQNVVWLFLALHLCAFYPLASAGIEPRRFAMALPGILSLAVIGCYRLTTGLRGAVWYRRFLPEMLLLFAVALSQGRSFAAYDKPREGFRDLVQVLASPRLQTAHLLLSLSDDGPILAEMAFDQSNSRRMVMRAGKLFARVDWSGYQYQLLHQTPEQAAAIIDRSPVNVLVIESMASPQVPNRQRILWPHQSLLWKMVERNPTRWTLLSRLPANSLRGEVSIYLLDGGRRRPNTSVTIHLEPMLSAPLQYSED